MKKIFSLAVALLVMAVSFGSCVSAEEKLRDAIEVCDKGCPVEVENGIYIDSFDLDEQNVMINVALDRNLYGEVALEDFALAIGAELEKTFTSDSDKDIIELVNACRETNHGILVKVRWNGENIAPAEYLIAPDKL